MKKGCPNSPFCNLLDPSTKEMLCRSATISYLSPKQVQTHQSEDQLEVIAKGALLKYTQFEDGSQESIDVLSEGDVIGEHLLLLGNPAFQSPHLMEGPNYSDFQTMALTDVTLCTYPIDIIRTLFDENREFSKAIIQTISQHVLRLQINAMKVRTLNGTEKVEFVYKVLKNLGVNMSLITQEELALIVGVSRNTIVRALKIIKD
jgi:CRP-like cAMP-binding protein